MRRTGRAKYEVHEGTGNTGGPCVNHSGPFMTVGSDLFDALYHEGRFRKLRDDGRIVVRDDTFWLLRMGKPGQDTERGVGGQVIRGPSTRVADFKPTYSTLLARARRAKIAGQAVR